MSDVRAERAADDARRSLWRALAVFRVLAAAFAVYADLRFRPDNARPGLALVVVAAILLWTAVGVVACLRARRGSTAAVLADVVVVAGLTLLTLPVQSAGQLDGSTPTLTTLWAAAPALAAGVRRGWRAGLAAALAQAAVSLVVRSGYDGRTLTNIVLLVLAGGLVGYVSTLFVRAQGELAAAAEQRAAAGAQLAAVAERERLARGIHDGVLQVLALVARQGAELGGPAAELGRLAAEQERSLRTLVAGGRGPVTAGLLDVAAPLRGLSGPRCTVAVPAGAVALPAATAGELVDATRAAVHNVERHAGDAARAWVLLEDLGDTVTVTVRDDGVGLPAGRLAAAAEEGRLGVAASIVGRIRAVGGTATVTGSPGRGVEVELCVPRVDTSTQNGHRG